MSHASMHTEIKVKLSLVPLVAVLGSIGLLVAAGFLFLKRSQTSRPVPPPSVEQLTVSLNAAIGNLWTTQAALTTTARKSSLTNVVALAKERQTALKKLINTDPARALRTATLTASSEKVPPDVRGYIEQPVALEGVFEHLHADDFQNKVSRESFFLKTDDKRYTLIFTGEAPDLRTGARIHVNGLAIGDDILINSTEPATLTQLVKATAEPQIQTIPSGQKRIAVILFNFPENRSQPWTTSQVQDIMLNNTQSVAAYEDEISHGALTIAAVNVYGWYELTTVSNDPCDPWWWGVEANRAAQAQGYNADDYDHTIYAFPWAFLCNWGGLAGDSNRVWINGWFNTPIIAHELGHNYGLDHASSIRCTDSNGAPVSLSTRCTRNEYGDEFDVMGVSRNHIAASRKTFAGWIPAADAVEVTTDGVYTLVPQEVVTPIPSIKSIRVPRRRDQDDFVIEWFHLEYRQPYGLFDTFPPSDPVVNGVSVRLGGRGASATPEDQRTYLVDTVPATLTVWDAPLQFGQTLLDPVSQVSMTTEFVSPSGATVRIDVPPMPPDTRPPLVTIASPPTNELIGPEGTLALGGSARDAGGLTTLTWTLDGSDLHSCTVSGLDATCPFNWSWADLSAEPHELRLRATDTAGNLGESSVTVSVFLDLAAGWPKSVSYFDLSKHLAADDLTPNSGKEIVGYEAFDGVIYDANFSPLTGWPVALNEDLQQQQDAAVWRGEGGSGYVAFTGQANVHLYTFAGTAVPGWPQPLASSATRPAVVEDVDEDGTPEVVNLSYDYPTEQYILQIRRLDGTLQLEQRGTAAGWPPVSLAVGDIIPPTAPGNRDPKEVTPAAVVGSGKEILVATHDQGLHLFSATGTEIMSGSWPVSLAGVSQQPTLANLDGQGGLETIVCTNAALHVLRPDGSEAPGWPQTLNSGECAVETARQPLAADLDGDRTFEIITTSGTMITTWNALGVQLTSFALPAMATTLPLKILDVDGDQDAEILVAMQVGMNFEGIVAAYERTGVPTTGWPRQFPFRVSQILADELDGDAGNELLIITWTTAYRFDLPSLVAAQRGQWNYEYASAKRGAVLEKCGDSTTFGSCSTKTSGMRCRNGVLTLDSTCRNTRPSKQEISP